MVPTAFFNLPDVDQRLMEALTELEDHTTRTGYPDWLTRDPDNMGWFRAESRTDFAAEALDKAQAESKGEPGREWIVRYLRTEPSTPTD